MFWKFSLENALLATAACNCSTSELQKVLRDRQFFSILTSKCASRHSSVQVFDIGTSKSGPKWCEADVFSAFSRHSGVQFLISPLTTWLRTRRFNEPTFRLTRHTHHWKTRHVATSLTFGEGESSFFWLSRYCSFVSLLFICFSTLHIVGSLLFKLPSMKQLVWVACTHRDVWVKNGSWIINLYNLFMRQGCMVWGSELHWCFRSSDPLADLRVPIFSTHCAFFLSHPKQLPLS